MPKTARRAQRRDENESSLVAEARLLGAYWNQLEAGQGADGVLTNRYGKHFYVEIKDPRKPSSQRQLTDSEKTLKREVESRGGKYRVVETLQQMQEVCFE